ncbi:MAG: phosphohydrolase [Methanomicrobiales archaeon HGW-Methanomicrobiales-4]|nr:MAG: phosphohydrolase [Methanomicrobiales archaeon HGW-Methanomicrobiales-4]
MESSIDQIRNHVIKVFQKPGAHGLDHILRVTRLCEIIGVREEANMAILIPAALFHDIARPVEEETGIPHEEEGARMAESFLLSILYPPDLIAGIIHAIRTHRYRSPHKPETLEAKILSDADKLDAIGAVGIARACITAGERNGDITDAIDHINEKLLKLSGVMYTSSARSLADERHKILTNFLKALLDEMEVLDI